MTVNTVFPAANATRDELNDATDTVVELRVDRAVVHRHVCCTCLHSQLPRQCGDKGQQPMQLGRTRDAAVVRPGFET